MFRIKNNFKKILTTVLGKGKKCRDETVIYVCEGKNEYTDGLLTGIIGANGERTQLEYDRDKPESRCRRMAGRTQVLPERFSGST